MPVQAKLGWMTWDGFGKRHHSRQFAAPAWLPDPLYICGCDFLVESGGSVHAGHPLILHDRHGEWTRASYLPAGETELPPLAPMANRNLIRVAFLDLATGDRAYKEHDPPIRHSRSEGDLFNLDMYDLPPSVWFCYSMEYLDPSGYDGQLPPEFAWAVGTFASKPAGEGGRSVRPSSDPRGISKFGFRFNAPEDGEVSLIKFRVETLLGSDTLVARLFSDNNEAPGEQIGNDSIPWFVGHYGDHEIQWDIGNGAIVRGGDPYWIAVESLDGTFSADIDTIVGASCSSSSRAKTVANMCDNLPSGEQWRFQVAAIKT